MRYWFLVLMVCAVAGLVIAATTVPTEIEQPGTQPGDRVRIRITERAPRFAKAVILEKFIPEN